MFEIAKYHQYIHYYIHYNITIPYNTTTTTYTGNNFTNVFGRLFSIKRVIFIYLFFIYSKF